MPSPPAPRAVPTRLDLLRARILGQLGRPWRSREVEGVPGRVHRADTMLANDSEQAVSDYLRAGRSAMDCLEHAARTGDRGLGDVESFLDFGCGHGRILRHLVRHVPPDRVTGADVDAEAVFFVAGEFGVRPHVCSWRIDDLELGRHEMIWSGSVLTHLDAEGCRVLLGKLTDAIAPNGLLVFSAHGRWSLDNLRLYGEPVASQGEELRREVEADGIAFREYGPEWGRFPRPYGLTFHRPEWLETTVAELTDGAVELLLWEEQAWDQHHDVYTFVRRV